MCCRDDHRFSLLHWAAKDGHKTIVEMLLSRGVRVNATNMGDDTPLHLAAAHGHQEIVLNVRRCHHSCIEYNKKSLCTYSYMVCTPLHMLHSIGFGCSI